MPGSIRSSTTRSAGGSRIRPQRGLAVLGLRDLVPAGAQVGDHHLPNCVVVVDDEDLGHAPDPRDSSEATSGPDDRRHRGHGGEQHRPDSRSRRASRSCRFSRYGSSAWAPNRQQRRQHGERDGARRNQGDGHDGRPCLLRQTARTTTYTDQHDERRQHRRRAAARRRRTRRPPRRGRPGAARSSSSQARAQAHSQTRGAHRGSSRGTRVMPATSIRSSHLVCSTPGRPGRDQPARGSRGRG